MAKRKALAAIVGGALGLGAMTRIVDVALIGGALATAAGAVGFAGYMTVTNTHTTRVYGMRYLAIFAQPSHHAEGEDGTRATALDMTPIGAIPRPQRTAPSGYALVGATESHAWLRDGDQIFAVRPGDDVPRLGRVARIALNEGRWTLFDGAGAALLASPQPTLTQTGEARFGKRMIFGDAP
jgi:hypothetical protein